MTDKKAQKIVVDLALTDNDKNLIDSGIILARIFNKDLCLFFHTSNRNKTKEFQARQKLESHLKGIIDIPFHNQTTIHISHVKKAFLLSTLADEDEAILFVAGSGRFKDYSKAVTNSPIPCLFIPPENQATAFQKVILPIDFRKETSDSVLWSSWFGRYANSEIIAVAADDKEGSTKKQVRLNVLLAKKLFQKSGVAHKIYKGTRSSFHNSYEALDYAKETDANLLVVLGSTVITPLDWIIGLPERKIIKKAEAIPVLVVNPRRDNYMLCG